MALYESNYLRLVHLLGGARSDVGELKSHTNNDQDLLLTIESSSRYTQVLRLTYLFEEPEGLIADPDLCVRVYFDARMTEVVSWAEYHRHAVLQDLHRRVRRPLNQCWNRNMVLSKWLDFLLDRGHSFTSASRCSEKSSSAAAATS